MSPKSLFTIVLVSISFFTSFSQECGFDIEQKRLRQNPDYVRQLQQSEEKILNYSPSGNMLNRASEVLTIPIVVHLLHLGESVGSGTNISDAQIQSSIDNLNDFYRGQTAASPLDFEIEFTLAHRDPDCNATSGINRIDASGIPNYSSDGVSFSGPGADETTLKDLSRWPETDYFNVWIVTEIDGNNGGSGFQGYANFFNGNPYEGSVMMHSVFGYDPSNNNPSWPLNFARDNSTVVHEVGHYFHLYHTFQGDDTNNDGVSDTCPSDLVDINNPVGKNSDGCADTVPHQRETSTCPVNNTCTGSPWVDNNTINNIMSYYWCADLMTNDQKTRVRAAMEGTTLVNSNASLPLDPTYDAPVASCNPNDATTLTGHYAGIVNVELNGKSFSTFSSFADGGNIDNSANCSNYFEIDATESNTINVSMFPSNDQQLGVWIDWNDDGDFNDEAEKQYYADNILEGTIVPIDLTYPTTIPYEDYVRIRVFTELGTVYGLPNIDNQPCYNNLAYGQYEDYTIYVQSSSGSTTYTYNNGWSPADPTGISLSTDTINVVAGDIIITANTQCDELTVEGGASVTVNSGVTLTTTTINLNSTSQSYSSLILDGTLTGTVNYNRFTASVGPIGTNDLIAAPVSGQAFGAFETANPNLPAFGTERAFAPYNTVAGAYQNYDAVTNSTTTIDSGTGFRTATTDGSTLTFTGTVLSSDVLNIPISDAEAGMAWNLIGNPYPSYIDFSTFFSMNQSEFDPAGSYQAIYGYDGDASNGWTVWNQATMLDNTVTELIAPGQAFFVKAKTSGGLIDFTTTMRRIGSDDDFIQGRSANTINIALSKLRLIGTDDQTDTQIYFIDGTTRGLDPGFDAGSYQGVADAFSIYTNLVENNEGLDMAIQSLPYNDFNDVVIPLGVKALANGALTIGLDPSSSLPQNINVYLEDTQENTLTLLNNSDYTFTPSGDLTGTGRFFLRYSSDTLSSLTTQLEDLLIYSNNSTKQVIIKGQLTTNSRVTLYDIQGRIVLEKNLNVSNTVNTINVNDMSAGVYIVKLTDGSTTKTQKLVIR